jgi:hypothetical protein
LTTCEQPPARAEDGFGQQPAALLPGQVEPVEEGVQFQPELGEALAAAGERHSIIMAKSPGETGECITGGRTADWGPLGSHAMVGFPVRSCGGRLVH